VVTGGGVTAGIDFALTVMAEIAGDDYAQLVQLSIEYAPAPPFNSEDLNSHRRTFSPIRRNAMSACVARAMQPSSERPHALPEAPLLSSVIIGSAAVSFTPTPASICANVSLEVQSEERPRELKIPRASAHEGSIPSPAPKVFFHHFQDEASRLSVVAVLSAPRPFLLSAGAVCQRDKPKRPSDTSTVRRPVRLREQAVREIDRWSETADPAVIAALAQSFAAVAVQPAAA